MGAHIKDLKKRLTRECGQTTIFVSVVMLFALVPLLGLVIEGGRLVVQYRQMQAAADMGALLGAQGLPSASSATTLATAAVANNLPGDLKSGATTTVCVPPKSLSPFSAFGDTSTHVYTDNGNAACSNTDDDFIEVRVTYSIGNIPIFNVPVTLSTHAIAKNGIPGVPDYSLVALDPTGAATGGYGIKLNMSSGGGIVTNGSVISNVPSSSSILRPGSATNIVCNGDWEVAGAANAATTGLTTYATAPSITYSPPGCGTATEDSPDQILSGVGQIADPYGSTVPPSSTNMPTCTQCETSGWAYDRTTGVWTSGSTWSGKFTKDSWELFPGEFANGITMNGNGQQAPPTLYLNPGVYTFDTSWKVTGGTMCIYGAPICDVINGVGTSPVPNTYCSNAVFPPIGTTDAKTWFYQCSPWGRWDTSSHAGEPAGLNTNAPTFMTSYSNHASSGIKLNGVTIYMKDGADGNLTWAGGGGGALAYPDPCAGTGAYNSGTKQVDFPQGASAGIYAYINTGTASTSSLPVQDGISDTTGYNVYPNTDLTDLTTCPSPALTWVGEFGNSASTGNGEKLNFLIFAQNTGSSVSLSGSGAQAWYGIIHTFPCSSSPCTKAPTSACTACTVSAGGTSGGAGGPPFLLGQVIADQETFSGSATIQVFARAKGRQASPGTMLIE